MTRFNRDPLYRRHRFTAEVIAHAVWLYFRFPLSLRMVEDLLAARGVIVSHQTVRLWAEKFGRHFANDIRRRSAGRLGDKWILMRLSPPWVERNTGFGGPLGRAGAKSPQCQGCETFDAQDPERAKRFAACDDHRQAALLRRGEAGDHARRRASSTQGTEQSGGELPSARTTKGKDHEALQVSATASVFRVHPRPDRKPLSHSPPRYSIRSPSRTANSSLGYLA